jgi:predicted nuclease of predicted toxin-antitoxin system
MRLLLDQGLPRSTVRHLSRHGIEAVHDGDLGLASAPDAVIVQAARDRGAVVVTLDADFRALLAQSGASSPSVIRIRVEGRKGDQLTDPLVRVIAADPHVESGVVVSVDERRIRQRRLPIGRDRRAP